MASLTRGLLWKEWRQLRLLRIGGGGLILFLPLLLLACAEAANRGWLPLFGSLASYSVATVIQNALPMVLSLAVWPLLALMIASQCFCADRASGTEWFWMERPVSPLAVWLTRIAASVGSLGLILGTHLAVWWGLVLVWGDRRTFDTVDAETRWLLMGDFTLNSVALVVLLGLFVGLAALCSGIAAASFVRSPMQTLLLGIVLVTLPLGLGEVLASSYPNARLGGAPLGAIFSWLLVPAYVVSSYWASCRGEPAGRGRTMRGLSVIGAAMLSIVLFTPPVSAWVALRVAILGLGNAEVRPSPDGRRILVRNFGEGSAWLVDAATASRLERFPPHVFSAAWDPEGERFAMIRTDRDGLAMDVLDRNGEVLLEGLDCGRCDDLIWVRGHLAVRTFAEGGWRLRLVDPETGVSREVEGVREFARPYVIGPTSAGSYFVLSDERSAGRTGDGEPASLSALDPETATVGERIAALGDDVLGSFSAISPSGRFCIVGGSGSWRIVDLEGGPDQAIGARPVWMRSDEPLYWERTPDSGFVVIAGTGATRRELKTFRAAHHATLSPSPDGARLLVVVWSKTDKPVGDTWTAAHWIYERASDSWSEFRVEPAVDSLGQATRLEWAGRERLALVGAGILALWSLDASDPPRFVIGG